MPSPRHAASLVSDSDVLAGCSPPLMWRTRGSSSEGAVNRSWLAFVGRPRVSGGHWLEAIHPDDRDAFLKRLAAAAARRSDFSASFRLRRHDGAFRRMMSTGRALVAANGRFHGFLGFCTDVTDQEEEESGFLPPDPVHAALLDEVRHRVRNTMQVIVGLMNVLKREAARGTLHDLGTMAARIQALALMQQYFYRSPDIIRDVELESFLRGFAADFVQDAQLGAVVEVNGPGERVDIGRATGVGLMVAEAMLGGDDRVEAGASIHVEVARTSAGLGIAIARELTAGFHLDEGSRSLSLLKLYSRLISAAPDILREGSNVRIVFSLSAT